MLPAMMVGCLSEARFHSFRSVSPSGWNKQDTLQFRFTPDSLRPAERLQAHIDLRYRNDFPYKQVYLIVHHRYHDPQNQVSTLTDTVCLALADSTGLLLKEGGNSRFQQSVSTRAVTCCRGGYWEVAIVHGMKDDKLIGLSELGLRIEPTEQPPTLVPLRKKAPLEPAVAPHVQAQEDEQQNGKTPKRRSPITEKREGNTDDRSQAQHHTDVDEQVEQEDTGHRVAVDPSEGGSLPLGQVEQSQNQSQEDQ